jgi:hypothetical protein
LKAAQSKAKTTHHRQSAVTADTLMADENFDPFENYTVQDNGLFCRNPGNPS